jgi:exonuclease VII large subunit
MDSIDKILDELKNEYEEQKHETNPQKLNSAQPSVKPSSKKSASSIDRLLAEVQADFEQQDLAEQLQKQQELEKERIRQEQLKAQKLEEQKNQAQEWLTKLDPLSPEGLWFESFAGSYPSKLEAAIEYLQMNN